MPKILLVDDCLDLLEALQMILEIHGYAVSIALNGAIALELVKENHFDCILSDIQMPVMDGIEFLTKLNQMNSQVPFAFLTGHYSPESPELKQVLGQSQFPIFEKPISAKKLVDMIAKLTEKP